MTEDEFKAYSDTIERQGDWAFRIEWRKRLWLLYTVTGASLLVVLFGLFSDLTWHAKALGVAAEAVMMLFVWLYWFTNAQVAAYERMYSITLAALHRQVREPEETTD